MSDPSMPSWHGWRRRQQQHVVAGPSWTAKRLPILHDIHLRTNSLSLLPIRERKKRTIEKRSIYNDGLFTAAKDQRDVPYGNDTVTKDRQNRRGGDLPSRRPRRYFPLLHCTYLQPTWKGRGKLPYPLCT